jgi:hypothetical protein
MRPWLHAAIVEFIMCALALVTVSLLTKPQPSASLEATTIHWSGTPSSAALPDAARRSVFADYRIWMGVLVTLTAVAWWLMR